MNYIMNANTMDVNYIMNDNTMDVNYIMSEIMGVNHHHGSAVKQSATSFLHAGLRCCACSSTCSMLNE